MKFYLINSLFILFILVFVQFVQVYVFVLDINLFVELLFCWEKFGQCRVNYGFDCDEIIVIVWEGLFIFICFKVEVVFINIYCCVVYFVNGIIEFFCFVGGDLCVG